MKVSEPSKNVLRPVRHPSVPRGAAAGAAVYWSLGTMPCSSGYCALANPRASRIAADVQNMILHAVGLECAGRRDVH